MKRNNQQSNNTPHDTYKQWFHSLKELDLQFWQKSENISCIKQPLNVQSINFYGEIFMCCVLKLKPCVLFSGLMVVGDELMQRYRKQVLEDCQSFQLFPSLEFRPILNAIETANETTYQGLYILYMRSEQVLVPTMEHVMFSLYNNDNNNRETSPLMLSEQFMSQILGYPVSLPEGEEMRALLSGQCDYGMCEVAYKDMSHTTHTTHNNNNNNNNNGRSSSSSSEQDGIVISTFGVRKTTSDLQMLKQHFLEWKKACEPYFPLDMELMVL